MRVIDGSTTREQLAAIVVKRLTDRGLNAVLVGGAVVSIYTDNKYESVDLDFISDGSHQAIREAMEELGFQAVGKDFVHKETSLTVEFPMGPLAIGDDEPVTAEGEIKIDKVKVMLFSPTQCVMDRLAWFYFSNDRQALDQAVWVYQSQKVNLTRVRELSQREGQEEKLQSFLMRIKK